MQTPSPAASAKVSFGLFEADLQTGELWKAGFRIKLQSQPFKVLTALLERPGQVVTREQLQERLWGRHTVVDFDHSLGTAINKIREALGDSADNPRFIETLARRGYRFIAPVSVIHPPAEDRPAEHPADDLPTRQPDPGPNQGPDRQPDRQPARQPAPPTPAALAELVRTVEPHPQRDAIPAAPIPAPIPVAPIPAVAKPSRPLWLAAGVLLILASGAAGYYLGRTRIPAPPRIQRLTHEGRIDPIVESMEGLPASATDGLRIFTSILSEGRTVLAQVDVHSGAVQPFTIPSEISSPMLGDLSPDGANLLLRSHLSPESEQPVWIVPTSGGSALRLSNIVAHDATWMPDGKAVLYAAGNQLTVSQLGDGALTPFATLPGRAFWLRWSPDGELLRFTLLDPVAHTARLWQVGRDGKNARPILTGWVQPSSVCCGAWTGDGRYFVFQANLAGDSDLWRLDRTDTSSPTRITNGPLSFEAPATPRSGHRIYFLGLENQSNLMQFDPTRKTFVPAPAFLAEANRVQYSRDLQWVVWTDQQGRLWRSRAGGAERIQVTPASFEVFLARWSPDGRQIALMARQPGKAWQIYTVSPEGGIPTAVFPENRNQGDPTWSADGQQIAFGRLSDLMGKESGPRSLQLLDLRTRTLSTIPHSDGLFSPRWSPDGRYLAAITLDQRRLMLLDTKTMQWRVAAETTVADPVWSPDGKALYYHAAQAEMQPIYRLEVPAGQPERVASLANFVNGDIADFFFCGLTPEGKPIVRSRTGTGDVYSIDLDGGNTN